MTLYQIYIMVKYKYYIFYWKFKKPAKKKSGFYGWTETNYSVLDQKAIGFGKIM